MIYLTTSLLSFPVRKMTQKVFVLLPLLEDSNGPNTCVMKRKMKYSQVTTSQFSPMTWTVFPGPWRVDGKGITYIRCTNYSFL